MVDYLNYFLVLNLECDNKNNHFVLDSTRQLADSVNFALVSFNVPRTLVKQVLGARN